MPAGPTGRRLLLVTHPFQQEVGPMYARVIRAHVHPRTSIRRWQRPGTTTCPWSRRCQGSGAATGPETGKPAPSPRSWYSTARTASARRKPDGAHAPACSVASRRVRLGRKPGSLRRASRHRNCPAGGARRCAVTDEPGKNSRARRAGSGASPSRQRGHPDCVAATVDALFIPAGQVGTIMADFVPNSGYKCSKNQSGRPDLNRRPLDPQSSALPNCATSRPPMRTL
jgi:hypothetical protein